ncbi:hypothetical protein AB0N09_34530 [Streptomyces erythrochromogenes]|uniref:hypothetical protein n=1 Tax=Streptomyces erythrochromogenes TaxID=285574 RepID=UPI00343ED29D
MNQHPRRRTPALRRRFAAATSVIGAAVAVSVLTLAAPASASAAPAGGDCGSYDSDRAANPPGGKDCHSTGVSYELQHTSVLNTFTVQPGVPHNGSTACPSGWSIQSGGIELSSPLMFLQKSIKGVSESWETTVNNNDPATTPTPHTYDVVIICSRLVAIQY